NQIFNLGGIQAIGALAYGTATIVAVEKITGPGNRFVTAAKKEVFGKVGIDFLAGPSEVLIIADETANPKFAAADLLAQAEHDPLARPFLLTTARKTAAKVAAELSRQLKTLSTQKTAKVALKNGRIILVRNLTEAVSLANRFAPEHLELMVKESARISPKLTNYGSLFIGNNSAEVFGDYCSGPNHTLPTNGAARYTGGLSPKDFVKILTYQEIGPKGIRKLVPLAVRLAQTEGLDAHRKAAQMREK
ncbi:MAG: histidinol dehydrogenase, partial [Candidatus Diapherotrites archaeon]|nr:histidinol dehydrogenase [Candidatus Diapherotrites archaeon]